MQVGAIGGSAPAAGGQAAGQKDGVLESIKKQIEQTKRELRSVAQDRSLESKDKLEKQKQLNERLAELQKQLAERQRTLQEEKAQKSDRPNSAQEQNAAGQAKEARGAGQIDSSELIEMDHQIRHLHQFDRITISMEGRANVLRAEIKQDESMGGASQVKLDELSDLEGRLSQVSRAFGGEILEDNEKAAARAEEGQEPGTKPTGEKDPEEDGQTKDEQDGKRL